MIGYDPYRVAPFGNPRIKAWLAAPRGLSQLPHVLLRLLMPRHPPDTLSSLGNVLSEPVSRPLNPLPRRSREFSAAFVLLVSRPFRARHRHAVLDHTHIVKKPHSQPAFGKLLSCGWPWCAGIRQTRFHGRLPLSSPKGSELRLPRSKVFPLERR